MNIRFSTTTDEQLFKGFKSFYDAERENYKGKDLIDAALNKIKGTYHHIRKADLEYAQEKIDRTYKDLNIKLAVMEEREAENLKYQFDKTDFVQELLKELLKPENNMEPEFPLSMEGTLRSIIGDTLVNCGVEESVAKDMVEKEEDATCRIKMGYIKDILWSYMNRYGNFLQYTEEGDNACEQISKKIYPLITNILAQTGVPIIQMLEFDSAFEPIYKFWLEAKPTYNSNK